MVVAEAMGEASGGDSFRYYVEVYTRTTLEVLSYQLPPYIFNIIFIYFIVYYEL